MQQTSMARDQPKDLLSVIQRFFQLQSAGGIVLVFASLVALLVVNSPLNDLYNFVFQDIKFRIGFSSGDGFDMQLNKSILLWINDGLMAVFFFLIGLEIKRELIDGELSSRDRALLPVMAAVGGMVVPAMIYWVVNRDIPGNIVGWAIPSATDIAFAICVVALAGSRVPVSIKILLMAIAVIDDLGAILIIALFYNHGFHLAPLGIAAIALAGLFVLNRRRVSAVAPYILLGIVLWVAVLQSGIHATIAGVVCALFIPLHDSHQPHRSPARHLEHNLHPWVAFGVLPLFGFANAGVPFTDMGLHSLADPVTVGIALGLLLGKPLGIFSMLFLAIRLGLSPMPYNANWCQLFGVSVLCGIGFTMSLFIGGLAFEGIDKQAAIRLGVLLGSLVAAALGYLVLRHGPSREAQRGDERFLRRMVQQVDFAFDERDR